MQHTDDSQEAVKAALASGEWREKQDPKSGRTYYVNVRTKASVWDLAKALGSAASAGSPSALQQPRQWQSEAAQLCARVTALECERVRLEGELGAMSPPVAATASALRGERARLLDMARSLESAAAEDLSARRAKAAELSRLQREAAALRAARQAEGDAAHARRARLADLRRERDEAAADLRREEAAGAALESAAAEAEAERRAAQAEEERVEALLQRQTEAVAHARAELRGICAQRAEAQRRRERLEAEIAAMDRGGDKGECEDEGPSPVLERLEREAGMLRRAAETDAKEVETAQLNRTAETVAADTRRAAQWAKEMRAQLRAVRPLVEEALKDMQRLKQEMRGA